MIEFCNGRYAARVGKDDDGWVLIIKKDTKDKNGDPKIREVHRYYGSLRLLCRSVLDHEACRCETAQQIIELFENAGELLTKEAAKRRLF